MDSSVAVYFPGVLSDTVVRDISVEVIGSVLLDAGDIGVESRDSDGVRNISDYNVRNGDAVASRDEVD